MHAQYCDKAPLSQLSDDALDAYLRWGTVDGDDGAAPRAVDRISDEDRRRRRAGTGGVGPLVGLLTGCGDPGSAVDGPPPKAVGVEGAPVALGATGAGQGRTLAAVRARVSAGDRVLLVADSPGLASRMGEVLTEAGVDVLCFGGTKNGMAVGDAVLFFHPQQAEGFDYRCKQAGQLASKMRFLSAPWVGLLENDAWMCVRPSGTEPKVKFYLGVKGASAEEADALLKTLKEHLPC